MYQSQVAVRYAKALLQFSEEQNAEEEVAADMQTLLKLFSEVPELHQVVNHPSLSGQQKKKMLKQVVTSGFHLVTNRFLDFICDQKREDQLAGMAHNYLLRYAEAKGLKRAVFTTAIAMTERERKAVVKMVETHYNVTLDFTEKIDKELIGGFVIEIDDKRIDASVTAQLKQIRQQLFAHQ
jgi:F-type H+-transporting ATPase subunit delta